MDGEAKRFTVLYAEYVHAIHVSRLAEEAHALAAITEYAAKIEVTRARAALKQAATYGHIFENDVLETFSCGSSTE